MKNLFLVLVFLTFTSNSVKASWLSKNSSLFGIELGSNISEYKQKKCLINHKYSYLNENNFLDLSFSEKDSTGPRWTTWIYTDSKLPVTSGCVEPKISNDDFFNFKVKIFPKTKEIYNISATYKRVYKYKKSELGEDLFNAFNPIEIDPKTKLPKKKKQIVLDVSKTQCNDRSRELINAVIKSNKKRGYRFDKLQRGFVFNSDFRESYNVYGGKKRGSEKELIRIISNCSIQGSGHNFIRNEQPYLSDTHNFLVKISIGLQHNQFSYRVKNEEDLLKEEMRGNTNKKLNTDGLQIKSFF